MEDSYNIVIAMMSIFATMLAVLVGLIQFQTSAPPSANSRWCADHKTEPSKHHYEKYQLIYTCIWIPVFAVVVGTQYYEHMDALQYNLLTGGLALPVVLQPLLYPGPADAKRPFLQRYSTKANLWIAIYSFIGNYWYTHYFYSVLEAEYLMPSTWINNSPLSFFFATHFYFSTYHCFSNMALRKVMTTYKENIMRTLLFASVVLSFGYFTAFMEAFTISAYPYYSYPDRDEMYKIGSAFYGIYFFVSFPGFYYFDQNVDDKQDGIKPSVTLWDTVVHSCGHGMLILCWLDFVRVYLQIPLTIELSPKGEYSHER